MPYYCGSISPQFRCMKNNKKSFSAFAICRILATQNHQSETPTIHISLDAKLLSRHRPKRRQR